MQRMAEALERFMVFKLMQERKLGFSLKALRTNPAGEFLSREFITYCESHGILHHFTVSYTPEHNGVTEKEKPNGGRVARSML